MKYIQFLILTLVFCATINAASVTLSWTAPQDNPSGPVNIYDIRYSTEMITSNNFDSCEYASGAVLLVPKQPGEPEQFIITGLDAVTEYYFAIVSIDLEGNKSPISNVASCYSNDDLSPNNIINLSCE